MCDVGTCADDRRRTEMTAVCHIMPGNDSTWPPEERVFPVAVRGEVGEVSRALDASIYGGITCDRP